MSVISLTSNDVHRETFRKLTAIEFDPFQLAPAGTDQEKLRHLLRAADAADDIFWRQTLSGFERDSLLRSVRDDEELQEMIEFHYGPYDRLNGFSPFLPVPPKPLGASYYPRELTREEFLAFLAPHPELRTSFDSPYTVIRNEDSKLSAIPYHECYGRQVACLREALLGAAELEDNVQFRTYLKQRADDVLTDNYYASEALWVRLCGAPLDLVIGPYEVYEDRLLGIKSAYEAMLLARDFEYSDKIRNLKHNLTALRRELERELQSSISVEESRVELSVATLVYTGGEARSAIPAIAFNLPNDERVTEEVGARQVILRNVLEAKFNSVAWPIAEQVLSSPSGDREMAFTSFLNHTVYHEISHSLGPHRIIVDGESTTVNNCLKQYHSVLEELKADVLGACLNLALADNSARGSLLDTYIAGFFRAARFGLDQAHGAANATQFNYLREHNAIAVERTGCVSADHDRARRILFQLASEVIGIQQRGDFDTARKFVSRFAVWSPELRSLTGRLGEIPIDIRIKYRK